MNKVVVLYQSKYGSTKKYMDFLKDKINCDIYQLDEITVKDIDNYDTIIMAGGIYASGIAGLKFLKKNISQFANKRVALFAVGASPYDEKAIMHIKEFNLKGIIADIPLFYGRGGYDESRMGIKDRTLCRMLKKMVAKKEPSTLEPWMMALLEAKDDGSYDWTDQAYLNPLLEYIRES